MKIIDIFANEKLFTFHYEGEDDHELDRLLNSWTEPEYLHKFLKANAKDIPNNKSRNQIFNEIQDNADEIEDLLIEVALLSEIEDKQYEVTVTNVNEDYFEIEARNQKGKAILWKGVNKFFNKLPERKKSKTGIRCAEI